MNRRFFAAAVTAALFAVNPLAHAAWPDDRPIELVVGFAPGGGTDTIARALARFMGKRLGPQARIVVVNKPGAGGEVAAAFVANAKPDGYTIGTINEPGFTFIPMTKKTAYQPAQLRMIGRLVDDPALIVASSESTAPRTLPEIIAALKAKPRSLSFGHSGDGTTGHLASLELDRLAGTQSVMVPFKGAGEAKLALMGGHIDYLIITTGEAVETQQKGSRMRAVSLFAERGIEGGPRTAREDGYDVRFSSERGIGAPRALPDDIAARLEQAIGDTLKDPAFIEAAKADAPVLAFMPGAQWQQHLDRSVEVLKPLVPLMGPR